MFSDAIRLLSVHMCATLVEHQFTILQCKTLHTHGLKYMSSAELSPAEPISKNT